MSRLDAGERREVEAHLEACELCSETVAAWREVVAGIRLGGTAVFEPHPDQRALREYAARGDAAGADAAAHVSACAVCDLEVGTLWIREEAARSRFAGPAPVPGPRVGPKRRWTVALGAAACVLIGAGLTILLRPVSQRTPPPPATAAQSSTPPTRPPGFVPLLLIRPSTRGETTVPRLEIDPGQPVVVLAARPTIPDDSADEDRLLLEVLDGGGQVVWSGDLPLGQARRQLLATEFVTVALPGDTLTPGPHELRVFQKPPGPSRSLLQVRFEIVLRTPISR